MDALMNHHDPARTSLVNRVHGITSALLFDEKPLRLRNPSDEPFELTILVQRPKKVYAVDASDVAFHLAYRGAKDGCAKRDLNSGSPLVTDRSNFAGTAVEHRGDDLEH